MKKYLTTRSPIFAAILCVALFAVSPVFGQLDKEIGESPSLEQIGTIKKLTSKQIKGSKLGIGFECLDRKVFDPSKIYDKVGKLGVKWARCQTGWARTETQKGKYDFAWLDDVVDNLLARGIQPWFNVGYGNPVYMGQTDNPTAVGHAPLYYGEECLQAWKNYVRALAAHFKGRVQLYEIWNEADIKKFWQPKKSDAGEYVRLIEITAKEILAADPDAKIGACSAGSGKFFSEMIQNGVGKILDFYSIHQYRMVPEPGYAKMIEKMRGEIAAQGAKTKLQQGEGGHPAFIPATCWVAKGKECWRQSNEDVQAKWLLRRYTLDLSNDLQISSFFMVIDFNSNYKVGGGGGYDEAVWGVMENGGEYRTRKVYDVIQNFCALFDNSVKLSDKKISLDVRREFLKPEKLEFASSACWTFQRDNKPIYVYYIPEDLQMRMRTLEDIPLIVEGGEALKNPVLIDMMSGKIYKLKKGLQAVPVTDYPLIVTDEATIADLIVKK